MVKEQFCSKSAAFWVMESYSIVDSFNVTTKPAAFRTTVGAASFSETVVHIYKVVRPLPHISRRNICNLPFNFKPILKCFIAPRYGVFREINFNF
jgi:hypothetical protein